MISISRSSYRNWGESSGCHWNMHGMDCFDDIFAPSVSLLKPGQGKVGVNDHIYCSLKDGDWWEDWHKDWAHLPSW